MAFLPWSILTSIIYIVMLKFHHYYRYFPILPIHSWFVSRHVIDIRGRKSDAANEIISEMRLKKMNTNVAEAAQGAEMISWWSGRIRWGFPSWWAPKDQRSWGGWNMMKLECNWSRFSVASVDEKTSWNCLQWWAPRTQHWGWLWTLDLREIPGRNKAMT